MRGPVKPPSHFVFDRDLRAVVARLRGPVCAAPFTVGDLVVLDGGAPPGVFRVRAGDEMLALKLVDDDETSRAMLAHEADAAAFGAGLGLGPAVRAWMPDVDALVFAFVPGVEADGSVASARAVGAALRVLHGASPVPWTQDLRGDLHEEIAAAVPAWPTPLRDAWPALEDAAWEALDASAGALVPCHDDLHAENVLMVDGRACFIDWAAAAMGDAAWDLGSFVSSVDPSDEARAALLEARYGTPTAAADARVALMTLLADAYSAAWFTNLEQVTEAERFVRRLDDARARGRVAAWSAVLRAG